MPVENLAFGFLPGQPGLTLLLLCEKCHGICNDQNWSEGSCFLVPPKKQVKITLYVHTYSEKILFNLLLLNFSTSE